MPRQPKPYYRKQTKSWYFSTGGKQYNLGQDHATAFAKFHEMMQAKDCLKSGAQTVYELSQSYLDWCETNRKSGTYLNHKRYLQGFIAHIGKRLKISAVKAHHVTKWIDDFECSSTSKNDAVSVVQRMFNWAIEQQYIAVSPIAKIVKPKRKRREVVYTAEQWKEIQTHARGSLCDLLDFLWLTGCRPKEARTLTANHVHEDLVIFQPEDAKGETDARVIYLIPEAKALVGEHADSNESHGRVISKFSRTSVDQRFHQVPTHSHQ